MANSSDYKRGYGKGYASGCGDQSKIELRHLHEMQAVAQRAERAESASGVGHCEDCLHWNRPRPEYGWGICSVGRAPGTPYGCWAQVMDAATYKHLQVSTSPRFGCVLFLPRDTSGVREGDK